MSRNIARYDMIEENILQQRLVSMKPCRHVRGQAAECCIVRRKHRYSPVLSSKCAKFRRKCAVHQSDKRTNIRVLTFHLAQRLRSYVLRLQQQENAENRE